MNSLRLNADILTTKLVAASNYQCNNKREK